MALFKSKFGFGNLNIFAFHIWYGYLFFYKKQDLFSLPLVVSVLASVGTFAFFGFVNLIAQIHTRAKHAAKFDLIVGLHDTNYVRVFIKIKTYLSSLLFFQSATNSQQLQVQKS
jgi:hypothetical protein